MNTSELANVFNTIVSIPGMNETVKIDLKISRKNALLLSQAIQRGILEKFDNNYPDLIKVISPETKQELVTISEDCLAKAGLLELSQQLLKL